MVPGVEATTGVEKWISSFTITQSKVKKKSTYRSPITQLFANKLKLNHSIICEEKILQLILGYSEELNTIHCDLERKIIPITAPFPLEIWAIVVSYADHLVSEVLDMLDWEMDHYQFTARIQLLFKGISSAFFYPKVLKNFIEEKSILDHIQELFSALKSYRIEYSQSIVLQYFFPLSEKCTSIQKRSVHAMDNQELAVIVNNFINMQELNLSRQVSITANGLRQLIQKSSLTALNLSQYDLGNFTTQQLNFLTELPQLVNLDLSFSQINRDSKNFLPSVLKYIPQLTSLNISHCFLSDDLIKKIIGLFPKLKALDLSSNALSEEGLKSLRTLSKLQFLNLARCGVACRITNIEVSYFGVTNRILHVISDLPQLITLNLSHGSGFGDSGIRELLRLQELREIVLSSCRLITDSGVKYLSKIPSLEKIDLSGSFTAFDGVITPEEIAKRLRMQARCLVL